jgi:phage shock protein E
VRDRWPIEIGAPARSPEQIYARSAKTQTNEETHPVHIAIIDERSSRVKVVESSFYQVINRRICPMRFTSFLIVALLATTPLAAKQAKPINPLIDYGGYVQLTGTVRPYRSKRLITLAEFKQRATNPKVLVLDARSASAFAEGHIEGAINLPFPDFTAESLAAVIGSDRNRAILIYCNNNFRNNKRPVMTKATPLALNIQTFVNLYGYGYKNISELGEAVTMDDPRVGWVKGAPPATASVS